MEQLRFIRPTKEYEKQAYEYIQEFIDYNSPINGVGGLNRYINNYDEWLKKLEEDRNRIPDEERVPSETFMLIREKDNKLLGIINIRLALNKALLEHGGHIGYSIRPTERRKGYNSYQLYQALKLCNKLDIKKVLITCNKDNIASSKSIKKFGGILENEVIDPTDNILTQRYWINVQDAINKNKPKRKQKKR